MILRNFQISRLERFSPSCLVIIMTAFLLSSFIATAFAQQKPKETRTVRLLYLNAPSDAPRTLHLHDGSTSQEVQLPRMNLSPIYEVPAGSLKLRLLLTPVETPELIPTNAPAVMIPETIGDAYLLCFSDPANPVVPLQVKVVDAGKDKFNNGQSQWFNLTQHTVAGKLGDKKVMLKPQARAIVDAPVRGDESYPVSISYMIKGDDRIHPICQTRWMNDMSSRHLVFVFTEPDRKLPRILGFADFRPSKTEPKTTPPTETNP
jgi:hypothetical protein